MKSSKRQQVMKSAIPEVRTISVGQMSLLCLDKIKPTSSDFLCLANTLHLQFIRFLYPWVFPPPAASKWDGEQEHRFGLKAIGKNAENNNQKCKIIPKQTSV
ncbi:hypothetical protein CSKR_112106 [Clonorchis sinensis]|uniref:Uncharacterized protein n=1 Tax=Clonorchis sinensis TaxID=79923 RepID=A0A3R7CI97_CLOSI|nr:hypothetical protein CSKR_112106 [Clonorchis sinensis]